MTDYFGDNVTVLDKNLANPLKKVGNGEKGRDVDTVFVMTNKNELRKEKGK